MNNTIEIIDILKNTDKLYKPDDFNDIITLQLIQSIQNEYSSLVLSTIDLTFNKFGDEIYDIGEDDLEKNNYYCLEDYYYKFITLPIFWQEIIILLYLSLKLHKNVENNSRVISIGESPLKLVYIQQILNTQPQFKEILIKHNFATEVDYTYFVISSLGTYLKLALHKLNIKNCNIIDPEVEFDIDNFMNKIIPVILQTEFNRSDKLQDLLEYFLYYHLDPLSIIKGGKKVYFQDRCESYTSIISLICIYRIMCDYLEITDSNRLIFYENVRIIGFNSIYHEQLHNEKVIINRSNNLIYRLFTKKTDVLTLDKYHYVQKHFMYLNISSNNNCLGNDFNLFQNQEDLLNKLIIFLTLPEDTLNNSRCIKKCRLILSQCNEISMENIINNRLKITGIDGENCNIINLFLMICINKLSPEYILNMIQNLDNIDEQMLFKNNNDMTKINNNIKEKSKQFSENSQNIFNNILVNKLIMNKTKQLSQNIANDIFVNRLIINNLKDSIKDILSILLEPCTYRLPFK